MPAMEEVAATMAGLKQWGYIPAAGKYLICEQRTLDNCMEDLNWALEDPTIKAIFCVRGGYGASEVMDVMPLERIAAAQKLMIGYSDISVYHSAWTSAGLPSIHAPMSASFMDLPVSCTAAEQQLLRGKIPAYKCAGSVYNRPGHAEGTLIGGNLSTLTAVLNTVYDCTRIGSTPILFLEDVGETMRHIHRYLTVMKHCGVFDRVSGIIFGEWTEIMDDPYYGETRGGQFISVADMSSRLMFPDINVPIAFGFPAGHDTTNYPLLMGERMQLTVCNDCFTLEYRR
jgi:muramoyltetrapeptide carboxypeptidase